MYQLRIASKPQQGRNYNVLRFNRYNRIVGHNWNYILSGGAMSSMTKHIIAGILFAPILYIFLVFFLSFGA